LQDSQYQNGDILDYIGAKDDGGGDYNCSYKMSKDPVKSSSPTNQHPNFLTRQMPFLSPNQQCQIITTNKPTPGFLQARCPSCHPTNSVKALAECSKRNIILSRFD